MKLTMNRREEQEGLFIKSSVYYLDVALEVTPEEMTLIKKNNWGDIVFCEGVFKSGSVIEWSLRNLLGKPNHFPFRNVNELAHVETQIIENSKKLKQQLGAAASFTSGGPREIEL